MSIKGGYGIGIVGCGMIADFHARAIKAMRGGHLECVFDLVSERAEMLAKRYGCQAYTDYNEFLAHKGMDIVTIATPSGVHMEPVVKAANAGKHILCEKPLEITLERIDRMIKVCKKNKVALCGIFPRRFNRASLEFKKAVEAGRLGKIVMADAYVKWFRTQEYYDSSGWRGTWKLDGGGALMNQSIHQVDLLIHMAGDIESVSAWADLATHKRIEVEDNLVAKLRFKNGALGVIEASTSCYSPTGHAAEVHVCGSNGSVFMQDDSLLKWEFRKKRASDEKVIKDLGTNAEAKGAGAVDPSAIDFNGHRLNFEDCVRAIRAGKKPAIDGKESRRAVEVILAIYKSALSDGKTVTLPLKKTPLRKSFKS